MAKSKQKSRKKIKRVKRQPKRKVTQKKRTAAKKKKATKVVRRKTVARRSKVQKKRPVVRPEKKSVKQRCVVKRKKTKTKPKVSSSCRHPIRNNKLPEFWCEALFGVWESACKKAANEMWEKEDREETDEENNNKNATIQFNEENSIQFKQAAYHPWIWWRSYRRWRRGNGNCKPRKAKSVARPSNV